MKPNIPTVFVIFGATGDLMSKKIVPALFHLYLKGKLPKLVSLIGFSRREINNDQFVSFISKILEDHGESGMEKKIDEFLKLFSYHLGKFHSLSDYNNLAETLGKIDGEWKACSNKLFYLAVPPQYYKTIFMNLSDSGLTIPCGADEGWTRVLVEKPFGKDLKTAEELDLLLGKLFKEEQIYRIDHYLAKEMIQNILNFRFSNNIFEASWNNQFIESIHIRLLEKIGVEERGKFYDGLGALRDVGQNHLLQMLALIAMDHPIRLDPESVRLKRAEVLDTLEIPNSTDIAQNTFRAQYEGYKNIDGVASSSQTETYFKVKTTLTSPKFRGIPIILESGKKLKEQVKEIVITFNHSTFCLFPEDVCMFLKNKIVIRLEPVESITIYFWSKAPGLESNVEERTLRFLYRKKKGKRQYVEEYEKLLLDCIEGNQLLFLSTQEVKATWKFVDKILEKWEEKKIPLSIYKPGSNQILNASKFVEDDHDSHRLRRQIGIVGLGKMGGNVARRLLEKGWNVSGFNRTSDVTRNLEKEGLVGTYSLEELVSKLSKPRIIWIMLPAGSVLDEILFAKEGLVRFLDKGDIVVDAGNSFYKDSVRREKKLARLRIKFIDVGTSGGPGGARYGASLMVGGEKDTFEYLYPLFRDLALVGGVEFFRGAGAGHFVKMIHNGIEYGMMQSLAEGFDILKNSSYKLNLKNIASVYNHGSVIESRLVGWLKDAFDLHGENLKDVSGSAAHTGEGAWTVKTAKELDIKIKIIEDALKFRIESEKKPSYTGKILSALREQFGGHSVKNK